MSMTTDKLSSQWDRWQSALDNGTRIESEKGDPASGCYKRNSGDGRVEAIMIWRNETGALECMRNVYGDGSRMHDDEIDELFSSCSMYPISHADFAATAEEGIPFPPEYGTRLTLDEIKRGVVWTPELGRKKLGASDMLDKNERAVVGDNSQHAAPHELLQGRINDLADKRRAWLREIGGTVVTQDHADKAADFAEAFGKLEKEAVETHKIEKEPYLKNGREVDARWKPIAALADTAKRDSKAMLTPYLRKKDDEAREAQRRATQEARSREEAAPSPVEAVKPRAGHSGRGVSLRTVCRTVVTDLQALAAYLASMQAPPPDFTEACRKAADKMLRAKVPVPGAELIEHQEAA
jgi:hypothetical protein